MDLLEDKQLIEIVSRLIALRKAMVEIGIKSLYGHGDCNACNMTFAGKITDVIWEVCIYAHVQEYETGSSMLYIISFISKDSGLTKYVTPEGKVFEAP